MRYIAAQYSFFHKAKKYSKSQYCKRCQCHHILLVLTTHMIPKFYQSLQIIACFSTWNKIQDLHESYACRLAGGSIAFSYELDIVNFSFRVRSVGAAHKNREAPRSINTGDARRWHLVTSHQSLVTAFKLIEFYMDYAPLPMLTTSY